MSRERDSNPRSTGYEPVEMSPSPSRIVLAIAPEPITPRRRRHDWLLALHYRAREAHRSVCPFGRDTEKHSTHCARAKFRLLGRRTAGPFGAAKSLSPFGRSGKKLWSFYHEEVPIRLWIGTGRLGHLPATTNQVLIASRLVVRATVESPQSQSPALSR